MNGYEVILSDIAKVQVGYQTRGKIEESLDGDFTIVRSQDFSDEGKLILDRVMRFFPNSSIDPQNYMITNGDILVQARGQNHKAYLIEESLENTVAANSFYIIRIKESAAVLPAYLTWFINQPKVQAYFEQEQGLSTIPFISKSGLSKTRVLLPLVEIQKKVSELISLWRQEQELMEQIAEKKESLIQAVARKALDHSLEAR